jgi:hypothetical protein
MSEEFDPFGYGGYTTNSDSFNYDVTADDSVEYEFIHNQELVSDRNVVRYTA